MDRLLCDQIMEEVDRKLKTANPDWECIEAHWLPASPACLRVYIDKPSGVDLDDCAFASALLEGSEFIPGRTSDSYTLEVSSPGIDRPLRRLNSFVPYCGQTVFFELKEQISNRKKSAGKLVSIDESGNFHIIIDGKLSWIFNWSHINRAHLVYDWSRP